MTSDGAAVERDNESETFVDTAIRLVVHGCGDLSLSDRLVVLQLAWSLLAGHLRGDALAIPGGFAAERDRQLEWLEREARLVGADVPDLELRLLIQENDWNGAVEYLRKQQDDFEKNRTAPCGDSIAISLTLNPLFSLNTMRTKKCD